MMPKNSVQVNLLHTGAGIIESEIRALLGTEHVDGLNVLVDMTPEMEIFVHVVGKNFDRKTFCAFSFVFSTVKDCVGVYLAL